MLKKEQLKGLPSYSIAFLARPPKVDGVESASFETTATTFRDDAGFYVLSNEMAHTFSPFNGKEMNLVPTEAKAVLDESDFTGEGEGSLVQACTCVNDKCGVDIFMTRPLAEVAAGNQFHCMVCATVNTAATPSANVEKTPDDVSAEAVTLENSTTTVEVPATVNPADAAAEAATETTEAADTTTADSSDDSYDDSYDDGSGDDSSSDDSSGDDDLSDDEIDSLIDDAAGDDDDSYDTDDVVDDTADGDTYDETDASAEVEEELETAFTEIATFGTEIVVDLTARVDVEPHSLQLASLNAEHNRLALFGFNKQTRQMEVLAYLNRDAAADFMQPLFAADKLKTLRDAIITASLDEKPLDTVGLEPITATFSVDTEVAARIEEEKASVAADNSSATEAYVEAFQNSMQIAMAGMNKGTYANPMLEEFAAVLEGFGIDGAETVAAKIVETAGHQYALAALETTEKLLGLSDEAREAVAATINNQDKGLTARTPVFQKRAEPVVATAHFEIPSTPIGGEDASRRKPMDKSLFDFSNVGHRILQ